MPTKSSPIGVFNYGNVLRNVSQVQNRNALTRNQLDPNSLDNQYRQEQINALNNPITSRPSAQDPSLKDFTAPSVADYLDTGDIRKLKRYDRPDKPYKVDTGTATEFWGINRNTNAPILIKSVPHNVQEAAEQKATGTQNIKAETEPAIQADIVTAKAKAELKWKPLITKAVTEATAAAKERGETLTDLARMEATLPGLQESVAELYQLADVATYTLGGQAWDEAVKQTGFGSTKGGTARAQFISIVDNQILPLLRMTFGAAFTAKEGDALRATLGDPNNTPDAKKAALDAFIAQKERNIRGKQLQLAAPPEPVDLQSLSLEELIQMREDTQ